MLSTKTSKADAVASARFLIDPVMELVLNRTRPYGRKR